LYSSSRPAKLEVVLGQERELGQEEALDEADVVVELA
jgi:hypothetical protein